MAVARGDREPSTIGDSTAGNSVTARINNSSVAMISGSCLQSGTVPTTTANSSGLTITLNSTACPSIAAGPTVNVTFFSDGPDYELPTSRSLRARTPPLSIRRPLRSPRAPPTLTAGTLSAGQTTTYTITGIGASNATGGAWSGLTTTATVLELTSTGSAITFASANNPTASYTVTYTPSGGTLDRRRYYCDAHRGWRSPYADHGVADKRDGLYRGRRRQPDTPGLQTRALPSSWRHDSSGMEGR